MTATRPIRAMSGLWSLGAIAVTAAATVGYFAGVGWPRVVAGILAAIVMPIALGAVATRQLSGARQEVCIVAALAGWSIFECTIGLGLWLFGVRVSSTSVGIPNIALLVALLLLTVPRALLRREVRGPLPHFRVRARTLLCLTLPALLLAGAALISIKSESNFYARGDALAISATRGRDGISIITVINSTAVARAVMIRITSGSGTDPQTVSRIVPANGRVEFRRPATSTRTLSATLYEHGSLLGSVSLRPRQVGTRSLLRFTSLRLGRSGGGGRLAGAPVWR
jgi:hypothetical protein